MTTDPVPAHQKSAVEIVNEYNAQFGITPPELSPTTEEDVPF